jgi:hypothetical protein
LEAVERDIVLMKDLETMCGRMKCLEMLDCTIVGNLVAGRYIR